jgi:hypothetical protein
MTEAACRKLNEVIIVLYLYILEWIGTVYDDVLGYE